MIIISLCFQKLKCNFRLKEKLRYITKEMEVIKTIVGHHLLNVFAENIAIAISELLAESAEEKTLKATCKKQRDSLAYALRDDNNLTWTRYFKNLKFSVRAVYSFNVKVIELNWERHTAKRLGKRSPATTRHMNYAIEQLAKGLGFKEIK